METLPKSTTERVYFKKCLTSIRGQENGILVGFDDGSEEGPFDLVVGCDGVNSVVKEYISSGTISKSSEKQKTAIYSGIRIRYAVQDTTPAPTSNSKQEATFFQYFGNGAYALAGTYGAGKGRDPVQCAYTIYLDDEYIGPFRKRDSNRPTGRVDENVDWSEMAQGTATRRMMLEQIQESGVPDSLVRPIIEKSSRFFELGVYLHNPFSSRGWRKQIPASGGRFCTMAGDAAHAMPPFLGQGANQAIQDSYCLAKMIFEYNAALGETDSSRDEINFEDTLRSYEKIRWEPTTNISVKSAVLGYLEAGPGLIAKVRDVVFFTLGKLGIAKKVYVNAALPKVDREET
jgi:salicylate hydroxylase